MTALIIGFVAGFLCMISFLPQVIKIFRTKQAKDLSLMTFSFFTLGVFFWLLYGILIKSVPIIATNIFMTLLSFLIVVMKIKYR